MNKKLLALVICAVMLFVAFSCGCTGGDDYQEEQKESHKLDITIYGKRTTSTIKYEGLFVQTSAEEGYHYFIVDLTMKNIGDEIVYTSSSYFTMSDTDGNTYDYSRDSSDLKNKFDTVDVRPGNKNSGEIAFEIPKDVVENELYYEDPYNEYNFNLQTVPWKMPEPFNLTITGVMETEFNETTGFRSVQTNITIENTYNEFITLYTHQFILTLKDGNTYEPDYPGKVYIELEAGETKDLELKWYEIYTQSELDYIEYNYAGCYAKADIPSQ